MRLESTYSPVLNKHVGAYERVWWEKALDLGYLST